MMASRTRACGFSFSTSCKEKEKKMANQKDEAIALDLHNRVTGEELEELLKMLLEALAANPEMASALPPLMVWGAPGLGKSSILRDVARELGIGFIDVRLALRRTVRCRSPPTSSCSTGGSASSIRFRTGGTSARRATGRKTARSRPRCRPPSPTAFCKSRCRRTSKANMRRGLSP